MPHCGVDFNDARCDNEIAPHWGMWWFKDEIMQKAKDMYQKKIRFPEDICQAIERNGELECRKFNTEVIYQLRKAYGLIEKKSPNCANSRG